MPNPFKIALLLGVMLLLSRAAWAQQHDPVKWTFSAAPLGGAEATLMFTASLEDGWHIYSQFMDEGGPLPTTLTFTPGDDYTLVGKVTEEGMPEKAYDEIFMMDITSFANTVVFMQRVVLHVPATTISGRIEYMVCTNEMCLPPTDVAFSLNVNVEKPEKKKKAASGPPVLKNNDTLKSGKTSAGPSLAVPGEDSLSRLAVGKGRKEPEAGNGARDAPGEFRAISQTDFTPVPGEFAGPGEPVNAKTQQLSDAEKGTDAIPPGRDNSASGGASLWHIFTGGLLGGLAAILMPCIFPMLPLTVSYFARQARSRRKAVALSLGYGLSIIILYVVPGLGITALFGSDALNDLSTSGIFNFFFFVLLLVFAASLLGAFDITLPAAWANKADAQADRGGISGIFFMAATLALVSFSCTGPIVGTLLVEAAAMENYLSPAIGMTGFATALALPFTLFSMFPAWLNALPRSGSWLNSVKVVLGFLELALALKFLSNVDLAYHWEWFDREVFLSLWIIISGLTGLYLLGKLKLSRDAETKHLSPARLFLAIIALAFTLYMVPGLWGAPLKGIAAFLPPQQTQDFDLYSTSLAGRGLVAPVNGQNKKYSNIFHAPYNLNAFFDYEEGLAYARSVNKPVMIDFTGHACVNCRKMEAVVWSDKRILSTLRNDYVLVQLYVDDKTPLPEPFVAASGKKIGTLGNLWSDFQASVFNANAQPYYVLLDGTGKQLVEAKGADYDAGSFGEFLQEGLNVFKRKINK